MKIFGKILLLCFAALAADAKNTRLSDLAQPARLGEFPYHIAIYNNGAFHCGGALISKTHVLTAAHCVKPLLGNPYTLSQRALVEVGSVRLGTGQSHRVARATCHPNYNDSPQETTFLPNDIGVLTLSTPVIESSAVRIIALPSAGTVVPINAQVVITGFGSSRPGTQVSPILKKDYFYIVTQDECNRYYQAVLRRGITSSHICAKSRPGYGTCFGDSGGPLVYNNQVIGVVSGGDGICSTGNPDIYTKVTSYLDFVMREMYAYRPRAI